MTKRIRADDAFRKSVGRQEAFSPEAVESLWHFLKEAHLEVDRVLVDPDLFYWLHPLYKITRTDLLGVKDKEGNWLQRPKYEAGILFRKASQMGASIWSIVFMLWLCIDLERPLGIACYWPTEKDLQDFIQTRLDPMLAGNVKMQSYMADTKVDSTRAKQIGRSTIYFRYVAGKASADSIPVDVLLCDEVRLWDTPKETIQRLKERLGQSDVRFFAYFSTVGSQGDFMEQEWAQSNQIKYFSLCRENDCHTEIASDPASPNRVFRGDDLDSANPELLLIRGVVLSDYLPDQFVQVTGRREGTYICPCCGSPVANPKAGGYAETRPDAEGMYALEFARTLSPRLSPFELLKEYNDAKDMKQFMNGYLAKPWLDPEGRPIKPEDWQRAKDKNLAWAEGGEGGTNDLGADFRAREMHYVILERPTGELDEGGIPIPGRVLRVGVYQKSDWKAFLEQLLERFDVRKAVIDYMPFTTDTLELADRYEGRVMLAMYKDGPMLRTGTQQGKGAGKVSPDAREKHMVYFDQVKSLNYSLTRFSRGYFRVPDAPLYQSAYIDRKKNEHDHFDVSEGMEGIGREGFKQHLMCLSLVTKFPDSRNNAGERAHESGAMVQEFQDAGGFDPHWAHAYNYAVMASQLEGGGASLIGTKTSELLQKQTHPAGWNVAQRATSPAAFYESVSQQGFTTPPIPRPSKRPEWRCKHCQYGPSEGRGECSLLRWDVGAEDPRCEYRGAFKPRKLF